MDDTILTEIDEVIFCTGYLYSVPECPPEMGLTRPDGLYVQHLYDQTFYAEDPSLVILGLQKQVIPFGTFQNQAIATVKVWAGKLQLPSIEIMRKDELLRLEKVNYMMKKYHSFDCSEGIAMTERWRRWIEEDKSRGWENSMRPWEWTQERIDIRASTQQRKRLFYKELDEGKWDHLQFDMA